MPEMGSPNLSKRTALEWCLADRRRLVRSPASTIPLDPGRAVVEVTVLSRVIAIPAQSYSEIPRFPDSLAVNWGDNGTVAAFNRDSGGICVKFQFWVSPNWAQWAKRSCSPKPARSSFARVARNEKAASAKSVRPSRASISSRRAFSLWRCSTSDAA